MKVLLEIKDDKAAFFLEVLKNFSFVKAKPLSAETPLLLQEIEQAVNNVNLAKQGKLKPKPITELLDEL
ncbi:hypothetical protein [Microcystis sp. M112S1]|uniref:hypothetical protein n=1 Tax=Microcystis sp. M112S1 TaxID=2771103 RepID=UPI00258B13FD|nr:hypothetical protein [Microcystis sp. M112S1]MCA2950809.1 hypothetical protein [Microcystis sp. M112S1]